jgi:uncharacterized membrane-anchored protein YitT (DUF2179 family)
LAPSKIAAGGVSGIAIILHHLFGFKIGLSVFLLNIPIYLIGIKTFGKLYGFKTFFGTVMLSFYIDFLRAVIPNADKLIDFSKGGNMILAPIFGGVIAGLGLGLIMKVGASTGGTDIIAQILHKFAKIPVGYALMTVDILVILSASIVFDLEKGLYAVLALYATGILINKVFVGISYSKMVYIISDQYDKIRNAIIFDINRGGTGFTGKGLYTDMDRKVIMTVLKAREINELKRLVKEIDPNAFVIISEVYEVLGEGFSPFNK